MTQQLRLVDVDVAGKKDVHIVHRRIRECAGFGQLQQWQQRMALLRCSADQAEKNVSTATTESGEIFNPVIAFGGDDVETWFGQWLSV